MKRRLLADLDYRSAICPTGVDEYSATTIPFAIREALMFSNSRDLPIDGIQNEIPAPSGRNWQDYSPAYRSSFLAAGLIQGLFLLLAALMLDGGHLLRAVWIAVISQWATTWIVLFRRPRNPTRLDLLIVRYGILAMLPIVMTFGPLLVQFLGLER